MFYYDRTTFAFPPYWDLTLQTWPTQRTLNKYIEQVDAKKYLSYEVCNYLAELVNKLDSNYEEIIFNYVLDDDLTSLL